MTNLSDDSVTLAYAYEPLNIGVKVKIKWCPNTHPMLLTVGSTGTGKSYFLQQLIGRLSVGFNGKAQIFLCDFKGIDFNTFSDCPRYWKYDACIDGLNAFYDSFKARISGEDKSTNRKFLIFDEWAGFILSRDKKTADELKSKLSTLLMMGRGAKHHVIIGLQRAEAQLFPLGGRDQFSAIMAMGNLSKEQKSMLFSDIPPEDMDATNKRGQGYLLLDGEPTVKRVVISTITIPSVPRLHQAIRDGLTR